MKIYYAFFHRKISCGTIAWDSEYETITRLLQNIQTKFVDKEQREWKVNRVYSE